MTAPSPLPLRARPHRRMLLATTLALVPLAQTALGQLSSPAPAPDFNPRSTRFVENRGQWPAPVRFRVGRGPFSAWIEDAGFLVDLGPARAVAEGAARGWTVGFRFVGGEAAARGEERLPGHHNYFIGDDPEAWLVDVCGFTRVRWPGLWSGIDLVLREGQGLFEYDFELAPGASPESIAIEVEGADGLVLDARGRLVVGTPLGDVIQTSPRAWYVAEGGQRVSLECAFRLLGENRFGFAIDAPADAELVIDPGLCWSTYLGDYDHDLASDVVFLPSGEVLVTGATFSSAYPVTPGAHDPTWNGNFDAFISRLSADGTTLLFSTFLGGSGYDAAAGIAVGSGGEIYVAGDTDSVDFPTPAGGYASSGQGGVDGFLARLDPSGSTLLFSTYLGSAGGEHLSGLALDTQNRPVVCGSTNDAAFPTTAGSFGPSFAGGTFGGGDAFVTRLVPDLSALDLSGFLGGTKNEIAHAVATGLDDRITVGGVTSSSDFPITAGVIDTTLTGSGTPQDGFVARIDADGQALSWSTFLGGVDDDVVHGLAVAPNGDCAAVGRSDSVDFPLTSNADQALPGGLADAFICRIDPSGSTLLYSTRAGGEDTDCARDVAFAQDDGLVVTGGTRSFDFPSRPWSHDTTFNSPVWSYLGDVFLLRYDAQGELVYGTYLGGRDEEEGLALALHANGRVALCGHTNSYDFPTPLGGYDVSYDLSYVPDGFVSVLDFARYPFPYGTPRINSQNSWAVITNEGIPSHSEGSFRLWVDGGILQSVAHFFWSNQAGSMPFAGGELLMRAPFHRLPLEQLDWLGSAHVDVPIDASMVGTTRYYQVWYLDPGDPWGIGLSEGLEVTIYP